MSSNLFTIRSVFALAGALIICSLVNVTSAADRPLIASDATWPGYFKNGVYVPDSVDTFRFVVTRQTCGYEPMHDHTCYALAAKCVFLMGVPASALEQAARETGHPELTNLPVMSDGECNVIPLDWLNSNVSGRVICHYSNFVIGNRSIFPAWVGIFQNQDGSGAPKQTYGGSGSVPEIYFPNWGWPHGYYGANTKVWPLYAKMAALCVPKSWNPRSGKPTLTPPMNACAATEYRGDPTTWHGTWPKIYAKSQYPGNNPGAGVWLPDEEYAWLWRAAVSRHPTQTQNDQGEANFGQTMSNATCAGQPNIMITSPSRPYQPKKEGGKDFPLYAINSAIDITVKNGFTATVPPYDLQKLEVYDGNRKLGELLPNAYNIYIFRNCRLTKPGMRGLIAIGTLKSGGQVTSRPAMLYVTDRFNAASTGTPDRVTPAPAHNAWAPKAVAIVRGGLTKSNALAMMRRYDLRGVSSTRTPMGSGLRVAPRSTGK